MTTNRNKMHKERRFRLSVRAAMITLVLFFSAAAVFVWLSVGNGGQTVSANDEAVAAAAQTRAPAIKPRPGHSDYLVGLTRKALSDGFGKDSVLLLSPARGPGRDAVAKRLRAIAIEKNSRFGPRISGAGLKAEPADARNLAFTGPRSYLRVSADGSKFAFRGDIDNPDEIKKARGAGAMIGKDDLDRLGRSFIKEALGEFVKLGSDESLTFLGVKYMRNGDYADDGRGNEEIVANIAVYGRKVRGIPVIGSGSKVAVWFANDKQPVGFDVDWPVYDTLKTQQKVLSHGRLEERVKATTVPPKGTDKASVARYECGYVDLGASRRGTRLQAGCSIHYAGRNDDGTLWGRVEYVPASDAVLPDAKWPLAGLIASGRVIHTGSAEFIRYASKNPPPRDDPSKDR